MKYIEVNSWEDNSKHFIPLNKIVDFEFGKSQTIITLTNNKIINIIESELTIKEMLNYHNVDMVSEKNIHMFYENLGEFQIKQESPYYEGDDELPF